VWCQRLARYPKIPQPVDTLLLKVTWYVAYSSYIEVACCDVQENQTGRSVSSVCLWTIFSHLSEIVQRRLFGRKWVLALSGQCCHFRFFARYDDRKYGSPMQWVSVLGLPVASWHVREVFIGNVMNFTGPINFSNLPVLIRFVVDSLRGLLYYSFEPGLILHPLFIILVARVFRCEMIFRTASSRVSLCSEGNVRPLGQSISFGVFGPSPFLRGVSQ
jgi:hypothetical protein